MALFFPRKCPDMSLKLPMPLELHPSIPVLPALAVMLPEPHHITILSILLGIEVKIS